MMSSNLKPSTVDGNYLNGLTFIEYAEIAKDAFPDLYHMLDQAAISGPEITRYIDWMNEISWEFEDTGSGGRGTAYNVAQKSLRNRNVGMTALLKCFSSTFAEMPSENTRILDVLGGDGTLARFVASLGGLRPRILTADLSRYMVGACLSQNLACIRQAATRSLFQEAVLDGVIIAYGSHHLSHDDRQLAVSEAFRTLRPGGRLVLHDFETGGKTAMWFEQVVNPFSRTGHPHLHFSRAEMWGLFEMAGFRDVRVFDFDDPFTLDGATEEDAKCNAALHMYRMYDLVKIADSEDDVPGRVLACIERILGEVEVRDAGDRFVATVPRQALVAVGTK